MAELAYREVYSMNKIAARRKLIQTYKQTGSIRATARIWRTSPQVIRKWVRRYQKEGEKGLQDRSRRPHHIPRRTPPELEEKVVEARRESGYGPKRLCLWLQHRGISLSPIPSAISLIAMAWSTPPDNAAPSTPPIGPGMKSSP